MCPWLFPHPGESASSARSRQAGPFTSVLECLWAGAKPFDDASMTVCSHDDGVREKERS